MDYPGITGTTKENEMTRITDKDLQGLCDRINTITGNPLTPYLPSVDGKCQPQGGCYHLSHAYGGVALHRMCATGTGVSDVLSAGHQPKRDLYSQMYAFIKGINTKEAV